MSRDEVLQHGEAFAEVGGNRGLDDFAGRLGHQTAHTRELTNLLFGTASTRVRHDVNGVDVAVAILSFESLEHFVGDFFSNVAPDGDDLVVAFAVGDGAVEVLLLHLDDFLFGVFDELVLVAGNEHVVDADGDAGLGGVIETQGLQVIEQFDGGFEPIAQVGVINELLHALLLEQAVDIGHLLRQVRIENHTADSGLNELTLHANGINVSHVLRVVGSGEVDEFTGVAQANWSQQFDFAGFKSEDDIFGSTEDATFTLGTGLGLGEVVKTQHHVLRRNGERQTVRGRKNVARAEHEHRGFDLRFRRKRNVHGHLVTVKVRVKGGANERVNADGFTFDECRFEGLNAQTVQGRSAVEKHGMFADDILEDVPDHGLLLLDHFLGLLDGGAVTLSFELVIDERLEELKSHLLGKTALVQFEFGTNDDDGTARVVHALAEEVLAETSLLTLKRIAEGFERTIVGATKNASTAAIVEESVDGFLEHALFVANDNVGSAKLHELFEAVVAVDDATIEVVKIRRGETATVERHKGTQLRRKNRNNVENHPLRLVAALAEGFQNFKALGELDALLERRIGFHFFAQIVG